MLIIIYIINLFGKDVALEYSLNPTPDILMTVVSRHMHSFSFFFRLDLQSLVSAESL